MALWWMVVVMASALVGGAGWLLSAWASPLLVTALCFALVTVSGYVVGFTNETLRSLTDLQLEAEAVDSSSAREVARALSHRRSVLISLRFVSLACAALAGGLGALAATGEDVAIRPVMLELGRALPTASFALLGGSLPYLLLLFSTSAELHDVRLEIARLVRIHSEGRRVLTDMIEARRRSGYEGTKVVA